MRHKKSFMVLGFLQDQFRRSLLWHSFSTTIVFAIDFIFDVQLCCTYIVGNFCLFFLFCTIMVRNKKEFRVSLLTKARDDLGRDVRVLKVVYELWRRRFGALQKRKRAGFVYEC